MLPTLSSYTLDEMLEARAPDQVVFSQLYVNPERSRTEEYVSKLEKAGVQALFVTVDAPQLGRREKDMRNKFTQQGSDVQGDDEDEGAVDRSQGATRAISSYIDPGLNWEDVPWLKKITSMRMPLRPSRLVWLAASCPTTVDVSSTPAVLALRCCLRSWKP